MDIQITDNNQAVELLQETIGKMFGKKVLDVDFQNACKQFVINDKYDSKKSLSVNVKNAIKYIAKFHARLH